MTCICIEVYVVINQFCILVFETTSIVTFVYSHMYVSASTFTPTVSPLSPSTDGDCFCYAVQCPILVFK